MSETEPTPGSPTGAPVHMPAPTPWPMVLAAGITLLFSGVLLYWAFSVVGAVVALVGGIGWLRQLETGVGDMGEERVPAEQRPPPVQPAAQPVEAMRPGLPGHRMRIPEKIHPLSAGIKGGIAGGLVMPIPALLYGVLSGKGIWYPINLLAGMVFLRYGDMPEESLKQFSPLALGVGIVIHAVMSLASGLIYGVLGPALPGDRPVFWGGVVMPLVWSGICYSMMGVVNPVLADHVSWPWFILSQFVFGITAGIVVERSEMVYVKQRKATLEAPGVLPSEPPA
ncbi:MAG: hypothetical protein JNM56_03695 [Planctomycetia bacterium]|nr:hypothetical protein [Planctomycetia bacterium]